MKTRRRQHGPPRCRSCNLPVAFFRSPFTGNMRAFNPKPVDMRTPLVDAAYPVFGGQAYKLADVVDLLLVARRCSRAEAEDEARDLPWHTLHACPEPADEDSTSSDQHAQGGTR